MGCSPVEVAAGWMSGETALIYSPTFHPSLPLVDSPILLWLSIHILLRTLAEESIMSRRHCFEVCFTFFAAKSMATTDDCGVEGNLGRAKFGSAVAKKSYQVSPEMGERGPPKLLTSNASIADQ